MKIVNIGIVAHVDAGKTSLTERILYETNVIPEIGRVDQGNTQTDSLALEKERGITIKASVVSFAIENLKVNLIDTPGHADFIAEVERAFSVLDGAILVISAVEGIQAQTRLLMSILIKLGIPTIIFINKIDRTGAQADTLIRQIKAKLTEHVIPLTLPLHPGTKQAAIVPQHARGEHLQECMELLTLHDDRLLAAYVNEAMPSEIEIARALCEQINAARIYPIFFGSAITGIGVPELLQGIATYLPRQRSLEEQALSAVVFKLEREPTGEKIAYVRIFSGVIRVREHITVLRATDADDVAHTEKVKRLFLFQTGKTVQATEGRAGDFCKIRGLEDIRIGDVLGERSEYMQDLHFASPQMQTRIEARKPSQHLLLYRSLRELAEEDPLIQVMTETLDHEIYLRLFGEVQKEVIAALLLEKYNLDVCFSETSVVYVEKPVGTGQALEVIGEGENIFYATVGFRVEPGVPGSGITYRLEVKLGALPLAFHRAIEESVFQTLKQGLYGWEVTDIVVILTHTGYSSPVTTASDFRKLVPLVLMSALQHAETNVYEPLYQFELSGPATSISQALFRVAALRGTFREPLLRGDSFQLSGELPVATTEQFQRGLHAFTEGEGVLLTSPGGVRQLEGSYPVRKRTDYNPLNRKDYLLHIFHATAR